MALRGEGWDQRLERLVQLESDQVGRRPSRRMEDESPAPAWTDSFVGRDRVCSKSLATKGSSMISPSNPWCSLFALGEHKIHSLRLHPESTPAFSSKKNRIPWNSDPRAKLSRLGGKSFCQHFALRPKTKRKEDRGSEAKKTTANTAYRSKGSARPPPGTETGPGSEVRGFGVIGTVANR